MKSILLKILSIISPVIILAALGIMQGVWFVFIVLFGKYSLVCAFLAAAKT